jgi:hypothetical protein
MPTRTFPIGLFLLAFAACGSNTSSSTSNGNDTDAGASDGGVANGDKGGTCSADTQTDADNCGACGHSCLGGTCTAGVCTPVVIAEDVGGANPDIAVDDASIFFSTQNPGYGLSAIAKDGSGSPRQVLAFTGNATVSFPGPFTLDAHDIYYVEGMGSPFTLGTVGKDGSNPKEVGKLGGSAPINVDPADTHLYLGCNQLITSYQLPGATNRQTISGPADLARPAYSCLIDQDGAFYTLLSANADSQGAVAKVVLAGANKSTATILGTLAAPNTSSRMAMDADYVYVIDASNDVQRVSKAGAGVTKVATGEPTNGNYMVQGRPFVDDRYVYWTMSESTNTTDAPPALVGKLLRAPKAGGTTETVLDKQPLLILGAMDSKRLYLTLGSDLHRSIIALAR